MCTYIHVQVYVYFVDHTYIYTYIYIYVYYDDLSTKESMQPSNTEWEGVDKAMKGATGIPKLAASQQDAFEQTNHFLKGNGVARTDCYCKFIIILDRIHGYRCGLGDVSELAAQFQCIIALESSCCMTYILKVVSV